MRSTPAVCQHGTIGAQELGIRLDLTTESRYQRRRRLLNNARWGKDGKWAKMADTLESVPVLGETALAPMTGFLRGAVDLYTTFRPDA